MLTRPLFALCFGLCLLLPAAAFAQEAPTAAVQLTAEQILDGIDKNMIFETRTSTVTMTVEGKRRTRTFSMQSFGRGADESAIEYTAPARDKGTRMLKQGDEMWLFMPSVDRTQKISGHMLRQGMMGSDVSYEDMMTSTELRTMYAAKVTGESEVDGRPCWTLEMIATDESVSYPKRISHVDQELFIPLRQELFALSGMLLKTWEMSHSKDFDGRQFPTRMVIQDELKKESRTIIEFGEMVFGVDVPEEVFSKRWLERR